MAATKRARQEPPTCHPDRPHWALGLCGQCYMRQFDAKRREARKAEGQRARSERPPAERKRPGPRARIPECHPDRKHCARGLCGACYQQDKRAGTLPTEQAKCHPERPVLARGLCHQCYGKLRYDEDPEKFRKAARVGQAGRRKRLRDELVAAYGGRCNCPRCPEINPAFLTLEHVNGDGKAHRAEVGSHSYADLRRRGWPQDGFTLLCWNCNAATRFGRTCPHMED